MQKKEFKGWGVLFAAFMLSFLPTSIMSNCFALYMNPVCSDLGFSVTSWSMISLIGSITSAVGAMVLAGVYQKKNMKLTMVVVSVVTSLCWVIATYCTAIWQFYLVFAIANISLAGLTQLPVSMLITAWFEDKRSTMMSVAFLGSGVGGLIWSPIVTKFITADPAGWRTAMLFTAAVVGVVMVIVSLVFVKRSPAEYGTIPYRTMSEEERAAAAEAAAAKQAQSWVGVSKKVATKSKAWKAILGVVMLIGALASGVTTHVPNYITGIANDGGTFAGTIFSIYSLVTIVGMLGGGVLMDKIGIKKTTLVATVLIAVGLGSLVMAGNNVVIAYGYSVFFAIAMCLPRLLPSVLMSEVFGTKDYAGIYALANLFFLIGAALGSVLTSILAGILGYSMTWIVYIVLAVLCYLCVAAALKGGAALKAQYPNGDEA